MKATAKTGNFPTRGAQSLLRSYALSDCVENRTVRSNEYRLTWKDLGYYNLIQMVLLAMLAISLLIWLIKGVE